MEVVDHFVDLIGGLAVQQIRMGVACVPSVDDFMGNVVLACSATQLLECACQGAFGRQEELGRLRGRMLA